MSEDYFSLDDYEPEYDNKAEYVDETHESDNNLGHQPSPKDGAIDYRQKNSGSGHSPKSKDQHDMAHREQAEDALNEKRKSFTQTVREERGLDATTQIEEPSSIR